MISFVIVHIGKKEFPKHIYDCVSQIRCFHENNDIYLAVNKSVKNMDKDRLDRLNCKVVYIESLKKTRKHRKWSLMTRLKKFWKYTAERFFVLEELMDAYDLEHVVQVESDNLLYYDWNMIEHQLEIYYPGLAVASDALDTCYASVVWINKKDALQNLNEFLTTKEARKCFSEMFMLRKFIEKNDYDTLPVLSKPELSKVLPWKDFGCNLNHLGGIFDAGTWGPYIGGGDRRTYIDILNGRYDAPRDEEFKELLNSNIEYGCVNISWKRDNDGRYLPEMDGVKIYNLHIHSKDLRKYSSVR